MAKTWYQSKGKLGAVLLFASSLIGGVVFYVSDGQSGVSYSEAIAGMVAAISLFGIRQAMDGK